MDNRTVHLTLEGVEHHTESVSARIEKSALYPNDEIFIHLVKDQTENVGFFVTRESTQELVDALMEKLMEMGE